ncbi:trigger factor [Acidobacteria bacterium AH-259-O06]|nr:trigger factor [Acidobacteria bacterium AH-259-O06]
MDIRVQLEDVSTVKKRLKVEVPADIALQEFNQVAGEYKKRARLPGFRPGKAPVQLVKRHFRRSIRSDVLQKLVPQSYDQAIREKGFQPLGKPSLENLTFEEGEPLVYEANFEIHPRIELPEYKGIAVTADLKPVTPEDVDEELEMLREKHSRLVPIEDQPIQKGDYAVIKLHGEYVDAEDHSHPHQPIQEENVVVKVGDEHTHEAFNKALLGMNVAEKRNFEIEYASDYPEKKFAGHKVLFSVEVTDIKHKELPELNDDFAKDLGDYETLQVLRERIKEQLTAQRERNRENDLKSRLLEQLIDRTSFEVPDVLVEDQTDSMIGDLAYQMASEGVDPTKANVNWVKVRADFRPEAEKRVRANMVLSEIGRRENVEVTSEELENELERMADSMDQPKEKVRQYFQQRNRMEGLKGQRVREKALKMLLESAKVVES